LLKLFKTTIPLYIALKKAKFEATNIVSPQLIPKFEMATPFLVLKTLLSLLFNSEKCENTFLNWYNYHKNQTPKKLIRDDLKIQNIWEAQGGAGYMAF